jgi:hypothetical protein
VIFACLFIEGVMRHEDANEEPPSRVSYRITVLSTHGSILRVYVRDVRAARGRDDL